MAAINYTAMSELTKALAAAGLIPHQCRRVVIDVQQGEPVKVYHDAFADERFGQAVTEGLLRDVEAGRVASAHAFEQEKRQQMERYERMRKAMESDEPHPMAGPLTRAMHAARKTPADEPSAVVGEG